MYLCYLGSPMLLLLTLIAFSDRQSTMPDPSPNLESADVFTPKICALGNHHNSMNASRSLASITVPSEPFCENRLWHQAGRSENSFSGVKLHFGPLCESVCGN